ncbi:MAG: FMN-binding protein [Candidatus Anammoxibacter sp.]
MKEKIWMVALLVIVALVSAVMLAVINIKTQPIVQRNNEIKLKKGVLEVFNLDYNDSSLDEVFDNNVDIVEKKEIVYYQLKKKNDQQDNSLIAFKISGPGFWATIHALIAMQSDYDTIAGIKFLKHEETPGLGGRIEEEWFYSQFKGKKIKPRLVKVPYDTAKTQNEFDAITGATETSRSIEKLINNGVNAFCAKLEGLN